MFEITVTITMLVGVVLVGAVLIQPGKGDLSAGFGGVGGQLGSMFGMRKTTDLLTKITIGLAAAVLLLSVIANKFFLPEGASDVKAPTTQGAEAPSASPQAPPPPTPSRAPQGGQQQQTLPK